MITETKHNKQLIADKIAGQNKSWLAVVGDDYEKEEVNYG